MSLASLGCGTQARVRQGRARVGYGSQVGAVRPTGPKDEMLGVPGQLLTTWSKLEPLSS